MTTNAILMKIDALLSHQSMTCSQLATELDVTPAEIITPLRKAVQSSVLLSAMGIIPLCCLRHLFRPQSESPCCCDDSTRR